MEYILWRYRNLSAIVYTTWRRPKHGGDRMLAGKNRILGQTPLKHVTHHRCHNPQANDKHSKLLKQNKTRQSINEMQSESYFD